MNSSLFHVACPFTGQAQCCCPHGSDFAQAVQQRGLSGNAAKQLFEVWRSRIPQAGHSRFNNTHSPVTGSTELLMPRLYRNPKSMEANNDLPVKVGGEMISKNQAAARLAKAMVEAKTLASHAAKLAVAAGQTFQIPPELEVDTSGLTFPEDLPILKKIASGAIVDRAKRGELSDLEEQQLLGLSSDDYCALRGMHVPGAMGQQQQQQQQETSVGQSGHTRQQSNRSSEDDGPSRDGMNTLRMKEIRSSLKGKTVLVKPPHTNSWERAIVQALDLKNRVAKLAFARTSSLVEIDLSQAVRDRVIAWDGNRPDARSSEAGDGVTAPGRSFSGGMGSQLSEQQQRTPQQLAMIQQYKQQQQQQQQQQQYKQMGFQGQMMPPRMGMQGGYPSPSGGNPAASMPRNQQGGGDMYQPRTPTNQGSVMEMLLKMGQRAVGLAVEIHSQSSQHSRQGIVRMVAPQQLCIVVQFGDVSTPLKASDEFRDFTIRVLNDGNGR